ncbi:MAG: lipid-A-disaccharide synthase [Muribaculaceae bacterium]|nr:lipid-A-disaccharide synthase [Muribaculaceae bacterium]
MKYMLVAGEASGDLHASNLITSLRKLDPDAEFRFFGGDLMAKAARRNPEVHYDRMNVMGFSEVLRKLPRLMRHLKQAKQLISEFRPDVLILVDYPSFNLKLAEYAHSIGIKVDYFISPKVWAWKEYRVKKIKKWVDHVYSILPFEVGFYQRHGYSVKYVGNPSVQEIDYALGHLPPRRHFVERQGFTDREKPIIALLPGSRKGEIRNNLPLMIEAAKRFPDFQYAVAAAPAIPEKFYREVAQDPGLQVVFGATPTLVKYSQAAIVTSGTATLETALIGTPQVVCYRANGKRLSYKIMEKLLKVKYVSLPNLIVGNSVVPELLVHLCTVDAIARELSPLLQPSPRRDWQISGYKNMRRRLGNSVASDYAAELITDDLGVVSASSQSGKEITNDASEHPAQPKPKKKRKPKPLREEHVDTPQDKKEGVEP